MQLISDIRRDARHPKSRPGSYEWWYFDGISEDGDYQVVIIFYDGCPFSTRYMKSVDKNPGNALSMPAGHPAISISLYHKGETIFYSMSQYPPDRCSFDDKKAALTVGGNSIRYTERERHGSDGFGSYDIRINERLPSGDELKGIITFSGMDPNESLFSEEKRTAESEGRKKTKKDSSVSPSVETRSKKSDGDESGHLWNLIYPRANMHCRINLISNGLITRDLIFEGTGYHDHNVGNEPMKESFRDWYWGRVHFPQATLVYYVMNKKSGKDHRAWLISPDNRRLLYSLELTRQRKKKTNGFFLRPARHLTFEDNELSIEVRHRTLSDSGPFYCRYMSTAILTHPTLETQSASGIAEYIRPERIHRRIYWPLVHMRFRYVDQKPHWVQKSPRLFRWTW